MDLGQTYNFSTLAPITLGANYQHLRLVDKMLLESAILKSDVVTTNSAVSDEIGMGVPFDVRSMEFYEFRTQSDEAVVMGASWIDQATIELAVSVTIDIAINDVEMVFIPTIEASLRSIGITNFSIKVR